jgi:hypothetical protein
VQVELQAQAVELVVQPTVMRLLLAQQTQAVAAAVVLLELQITLAVQAVQALSSLDTQTLKQLLLVQV